MVAPVLNRRDKEWHWGGGVVLIFNYRDTKWPWRCFKWWSFFASGKQTASDTRTTEYVIHGNTNYQLKKLKKKTYKWKIILFYIYWYMKHIIYINLPIYGKNLYIILHSVIFVQLTKLIVLLIFWGSAQAHCEPGASELLQIGWTLQ